MCKFICLDYGVYKRFIPINAIKKIDVPKHNYTLLIETFEDDQPFHKVFTSIKARNDVVKLILRGDEEVVVV